MQQPIKLQKRRGSRSFWLKCVTDVISISYSESYDLIIYLLLVPLNLHNSQHDLWTGDIWMQIVQVTTTLKPWQFYCKITERLKLIVEYDNFKSLMQFWWKHLIISRLRSQTHVQSIPCLAEKHENPRIVSSSWNKTIIVAIISDS